MDYQPAVGDIFEFFEHHKLMVGYCIEVGSNKLRVLTETNREINLKPSRILHATRGKPVFPFRKETILNQLKTLSNRRELLSKQIDIPALWRDLNSPGDTLNIHDLAELVFDEPITPDHEAALMRAILADRIHFKMVNRQVEIQTTEWVETEKKKLAKAKAREKEQSELAAWLISKIKGEEPSTSPPKLNDFIHGMIALAAGQPNRSDTTWIKSILKKAAIISPDNLLQILIKIKLISPDENLDLIRFQFPTAFSQNALEEASYIALRKTIPDRESRKELLSLYTFTIDSKETKDMDDAISIQENADGTISVFIHITDVSNLIPTGSFLDEEARERAQTLYFPEKTYPMFPVSVSHHIASLETGSEKITITTEARFNHQYKLLSYEIYPSIISVDEKFDYDDVDKKISSDPFNTLYKICLQLQNERKQNGAIIIPQPELEIYVDAKGSIHIKKRIRETPSKIMVSELMILTNYLAAKKADDAKIHFPFRAQSPPSEQLPSQPSSFDPYIAYRHRRLMNRAVSTLKAEPHFSLGLPCYTNITSPLRRYFDLIAQRQLKALLGLESLYDKDDISRLIMEFDVLYGQTNQMIAARKRYWILKHLASQTGKILNAIVLDKFPRRYQIWLTDYLMDADLPTMFGISLHPQDHIQVVIESVNPRKNQLKLRLVE